jgi:hypothetical protein
MRAHRESIIHLSMCDKIWGLERYPQDGESQNTHPSMVPPWKEEW